MTTAEEADWNYFAKDRKYSDVLKARLADGVEMDSATALAEYMNKHCRGDLRILDFGAGPGHYYPVIKRLYAGGTVAYVGVDIDESNVRYGAEHFRDDSRCRLRVGSVLEPDALDAADVNCNCIVSANTLPHVPTIVPLLTHLAQSAATTFIFRMLIGSECVQIKKHLRENDFDGMYERNFQLNNIYSLAFLKRYLGPSWSLLVEPDVFDEKRLQEHRIPAQSADEFYANRVSRSVGSLVFKGEIYMPWKFVVGIRA